MFVQDCYSFLNHMFLVFILESTIMNTYITLLVLFISTASLVKGHGRLMEPASRASAWRKGFNTPANYDDNQLFCGGSDVSLKNRSVYLHNLLESIFNILFLGF